MKKILLSVILLFTIPLVFADHQRAAEIIYKHINNLTYEARIITYTKDNFVNNQRDYLTIEWGDGSSEEIPRIIKDINGNIVYNEYLGIHTYSAPGTYMLSMEDPTRNYGIINIPNSINIPTYVESELVINPFLGYNSSVVLLNRPIDYGCVGKIFIHNPGAYDIDGDSISYKLVECRGAEGLVIPGYTFPAASHFFTLNPRTGDVIWDSPLTQGKYNIAFLIEEWRNGVRVGYVTRDMQILIDICDNYPPIINTITDTCIEAGEFLTFEVTATDPDGDQVTLSANGGPFLQNDSPAEMVPNPATGNVSVTADFNWQTTCSHIIKNFHSAFFKAIDNSNPVQLSSYKTVNITIVGPAPENLEASPLGTSIILTWNKSSCPNATAYWIYRKSSYYGFIPGPCETGVPVYTGYSKITEIADINDTIYTDDNDGNGLIHGIEYCYMIIAVFPDGAESYASNEACATLKKDLPIITNVSVNNTSINNGLIYVAWSKPTELDTIQTPGPFQYQVYRKNNTQGSDFEWITTFYNLNDTIFTDIFLNTKEFQYRYKIDFYNDEPGNFFKIGSTYKTPSIYLTFFETDRTLILNWNNDVPWINDTFVVYRQNPLTFDFDSIGWSDIPEFADTGLINGKEYCYKIKSVGRYSAPGLIDPIINFSQENCGIPVDNVPPCAPILSVFPDCEQLINELSWIYPDTCESEKLKFYIYYAGTLSNDYWLIDSTEFITDVHEIMTYIHKTNPPSTVGCYVITALDSLWNQSLYSNKVCVDTCKGYKLPNVFTPNGDQWNNEFQAKPESIGSVKKIDLKIFNRWGTIVFESEDPYFKWDGRDQSNNRDCTEGVYFFECIVSEFTLRGPVERKITGSVTLLR